jgi:ABC-type phosphate/phosphonate transport system substrate-binding protein
LKWSTIAPLICLLMSLSTPFAAAADNTPLIPSKVTIAFVQRSFLGVNVLDVEAALKLFIRGIGQQWGYDVQAKVQRFKNAEELSAIADAEKPEIIMVDSWTYLEMTDTEWMDPFFISSDEGLTATSYLLLTRKQNGKKLLDLRGKHINLLTTTNANLGIHWLSSLLHERKLGLPDKFFSELNFSTDPMQAVLPVFFGKTDAVVVDSVEFKLMTELNPQLGNLLPVAVSEPLVNNLICLKRSGWESENLKRKVIRNLASLHLQEAGKQTLLLFKIQKLEKFNPACLDTMRKIHKELGPQEKNFLLQGIDS